MNSLLPPTAAKADRAIELAIASRIPRGLDILSLWNPATCPIALLPWLAWGLSVDIWDPAWPEATKRQQVAQAIERQRRKGSVLAVREVIDAFGVGLTLHEWFEPDVQTAPYTFEVRLPVDGGETALASFIETVADQVVRVKPARAHFTVAQTLSAETGLGILGVARAAAARRQGLVQAPDIDWTGCLLTEDGEPLLTESQARMESTSP